MRQLHIYGFRKTSDDGAGQHEFKHPAFVRGAAPLELASALRRNSGKPEALAVAASSTGGMRAAVSASAAAHAAPTAFSGGSFAAAAPAPPQLPAAGYSAPFTAAQAHPSQGTRVAAAAAAAGVGGLLGLAAAAAVVGAEAPAPAAVAAAASINTHIGGLAIPLSVSPAWALSTTAAAAVLLPAGDPEAVAASSDDAGTHATAGALYAGGPSSAATLLPLPPSSGPAHAEASLRPASAATPSHMAGSGTDSPAPLMPPFPPPLVAPPAPGGTGFTAGVSRQRHGGGARKVPAAAMGLPRSSAAQPPRLAGTKSARSGSSSRGGGGGGGGGDAGDILHELKAFGRRQREMIGRVRGIELHNEQLARDNARLFAELAQLQSLQAGIQAVLHTAVTEGIDAMQVLVKRGSGRR